MRALIVSSLALVVAMSGAAHAQAPADAQVLKTYGDIALAGYEYSLTTAPRGRATSSGLLAHCVENALPHFLQSTRGNTRFFLVC